MNGLADNSRLHLVDGGWAYFSRRTGAGYVSVIIILVRFSLFYCFLDHLQYSRLFIRLTKSPCVLKPVLKDEDDSSVFMFVCLCIINSLVHFYTYTGPIKTYQGS